MLVHFALEESFSIPVAEAVALDIPVIDKPWRKAMLFTFEVWGSRPAPRYALLQERGPGDAAFPYDLKLGLAPEWAT